MLGACVITMTLGACVLERSGTGDHFAGFGGGGAGGMGGVGGVGGDASTSSTASTTSQTSGGGQGGDGGAAPECGNGALEAGEQCDDGNNIDGDGCSATCIADEPTDGCPGEAYALTSAGLLIDGNTQEHADKLSASCGGSSAPDAIYEITPQSSGTLVATLTALYVKPILYVQSGCPGGTEAACSGSAAPSVSVVVAAGSKVNVVVDGSAGTFGAYQLQLKLTSCGNGTLEAPEECDDGNGVAGDGCSSCKVECGCDGCAGIIEHKDPATNHCYRLVTNANTTWGNARNACIAWGGDLAALSTQAEINALVPLVVAPGDDDVWVGASDSAVEGTFAWSNGETFIYVSNQPPWAGGEPNNFFGEDCVEAYDNGTFNDDSCSKNNDFLCERRPAGGL